MQPISQVLIGSAGSLQPRVGQGGGMGAAPAPTISTAGQTQSVSMSSSFSSMSQSMAITRVHSQVAQMLQSVGGGLEHDKTLQMLIATILLMALLEASQKDTQGTAETLQALGGGGQGSGQSQSLSLYASYTSISIQQTSISSVTTSSFSSSMDITGAPPVGNQLDSLA